MNVGAVIVTIRLLAGLYGVDAQMMDCMVQHESDYDVTAVNGVNVGLCQWNPSTRDWLGEKAWEDPAWAHGDIGAGPVFDLALMAWAIRSGYQSHWSTLRLCGGEG